LNDFFYTRLKFFQGLTLEQFRQGARSLSGGGQEVKVQISPSYRKIRRHGRTQFIDTQDKIKETSSSHQEVYPSARPVFVNTISDEDIEQKIREANRKEQERELEEGSGIEILEVIDEAIDEAIEQVIEDKIQDEMDEFDNDSVNTKLSPQKLEEEIDIIEHMINDNKMIQIVNDIMNFEDVKNVEMNDENTVTFETNPVIIEERKHIKNIDGFDIGLNSLPTGSSVIENIPLTSQILIIEDPIDQDSELPQNDIIQTVNNPVKKVPISSIDFGLIQEV